MPLVRSAIDKTALIKRLGRKLVSALYSILLGLFSLTFLSSALLNNTAIVASLIGQLSKTTSSCLSITPALIRSYFRRYGNLNWYVCQPDRRQQQEHGSGFNFWLTLYGTVGFKLLPCFYYFLCYLILAIKVITITSIWLKPKWSLVQNS